MRAPHSALAWVQSTPLGREVVPEVYCTLHAARGSGAWRGSGSASSASKWWLRSVGCGGGTPLSSAVTASHFSRVQCVATNSAKRGWVMPATASLCSA